MTLLSRLNRPASLLEATALVLCFGLGFVALAANL